MALPALNFFGVVMNSLLKFLILMLLTNYTFAMLPPEYLQVANFKKCLAVKNMGSWQALCLPSIKPQNCPPNSWSKLIKQKELNKCSAT